MKRTMLIILSCVVALLVAMLLGVSYLSTKIFGEGARQACNNRLVNSISIANGSVTATVEDDMCDEGLVITGTYKVVLRHRELGHVVDTLLLISNNMGQKSHAPEVKLVAPATLVITGQKDMVVEQGPIEVAGLRIKYELE